VCQCETPMAKNDPCLIAWERFKQSDNYKNLRRWALHGEEYIDGQLWGVWNRAYFAAIDASKEKGQ
jgi:hypothetical protein